MERFTIRITNENIYFNSSDSLNIHQTNIPIDYLSFKTHNSIYWEVEIEYYDTKLCMLNVRVLDIQNACSDSFIDQKIKYPINKLQFAKIDWKIIESSLSFFQKSGLTDFIDFNNDELIENELDNNNGFYAMRTAAYEQPVSIKTVTIDKVFKVKISELTFGEGKVFFSWEFKKLKQHLHIEVTNKFIRKEFENIKPWFAKVIGNAIKIHVTIVCSNNEITKNTAYSEEIDSINHDTIELIRQKRMSFLVRKQFPLENTKSILSIDELLKEPNSQNLSDNLFNQTELEIVHYIIKKETPANKKQLLYLSGSKQSINHKIKFTTHPEFGFIFCISEDAKTHFVWELLNSHATYIWSFDKTITKESEQQQLLEKEIFYIKTQGRNNYKKHIHNCQNSNKFEFNLIEHNYSSTSESDRYNNWELKIAELTN